MAVSDELLDEIAAGLGSAVMPQLLPELASSDLFEAYVFTLAIEAAKREGGQVTYRDPSDSATTEFVFRTSPGHLWSSAKPYTFALIQFPNAEALEAHLGVRVSGKSGVLHECDVCVLRRSEAETSRQEHVHPRSSQIIVSVECKFYTSHIDLKLAREFLGLGDDLSSKNGFFVTNSSSLSVEKLLSARGRKWAHRVYPASSIDAERVRNEFQTAFKVFKAL